MPNYRRNFIPGGSDFFTVAAADRTSSILVDNIDLLKHAMRIAKKCKKMGKVQPDPLDFWMLLSTEIFFEEWLFS